MKKLYPSQFTRRQDQIINITDVAEKTVFKDFRVESSDDLKMLYWPRVCKSSGQFLQLI